MGFCTAVLRCFCCCCVVGMTKEMGSDAVDGVGERCGRGHCAKPYRNTSMTPSVM